ncbi:MAG: acyl-CoA dehydrogenase family protein [bacterium]
MKNMTINNSEVSPLTHLTEKEERFRERTQNFAKHYVMPLVFEMDKSAQIDRGLIEKIFEQGLMSIEIPIEYGGRNGSFFDSIIAIEEMAVVDPAVAVFIDVQNTLVINTIMRWGTEEQKRKYLPMLAKNTVGAFSITEKEAGSDATALSCKAKNVDGGYLLNGEKHWVTNAAEADIFIIFAKEQKTEGEEGRLTAFIVDRRETNGLTICDSEEKMGIRASSTCNIILENVFVPKENVLRAIGRGLNIALETLTDGRIGIGAQMLGLARGAFIAAVEYAQTRKQFGQTISNFQGIHFPLAQMSTEIEAARLFVYHVSRLKSAKSDFKELFTLSSMTKLFASQVAEKVVSQGLEIFGGKGYMKGNILEKLYRDAKIGKIYEGTSNMQLRLIARNFIVNDINKLTSAKI